MEHVRYLLLSHIHDYVTYSAIGAHAMGFRSPNSTKPLSRQFIVVQLFP